MDYKDTINLPSTSFPMKANLPNREPVILESWNSARMYERIINKRKPSGRKYVLHDGPPYSNGDIHMGHALNKILKDIVVKFKAMTGNEVPFIPGWDCHGLPVEHQLMKNLKIEKNDMPQVKFREKARDFALKYVNIHKEEFKRLGIFGDWEHPYLTLNPAYEAAIVRSFAQLVGKGYVYKALKPVNWCFKCETALAEAEVEYEAHTSPSIFVKFALKDIDKFKKILAGQAREEMKKDVHVLIWTTTPWTLVANAAIALSPSIRYVLIESVEGCFVFAEGLQDAVTKKAGLRDVKTLASFYGKELEGLCCAHPFINRDSKIVLADYVSQEDGSGCVHTAPGHGQEDYLTGKKYNLPTIMPVNAGGCFDETAGEFANMHVFSANEKIIDKLKQIGALLHTEPISHTYPHCWRCKNPIIFRATAQYFVNVDHNGLRERACADIGNNVRWLPHTGKERILAMVRNRPDWCLSRQRLWGVPITAFYCASCEELILDKELILHVADIFEKEGSNAWFAMDAKDLLPKGASCKKCGGQKFIKETDILDVWFESGVSHEAVLRARGEFPADLYLEGSDQHRGWFQSALLSAEAMSGEPPYKAVLTHGFVVDGEGKKMSKSLGNVISPEEIMKKYGADILRIWVASCDYSEDVRLSKVILERLAEAYRKIRNTSRFVLGNLNDFDPQINAQPIEKWSEIDRWAFWRMLALLESVEDNFRQFTFHKAFSSIYNFCVVDMSSIYLDVSKDILYTAGKNSIARRSAQSCLFEIINVLTRVMAPILAYTSDEIWRAIPNRMGEDSIHMEDWPDLSFLKKRLEGRFEKDSIALWNEKLLPLRGCVLKELEGARGKGLIGSSLESSVILYSDEKTWQDFLNTKKHLLSMFFIVSLVEISGKDLEASVPAEGIPVKILIKKANGLKCQRCWNYSLSVGSEKEHPALCARCVLAVKCWPK